MLHLALKQCLESVPEVEVNRRQVYMSALKGDHAVVVSEPGWVKSPRFIVSLINSLEEVKGDGFAQVLKNLEAQMKPSTLMVDFIVPEVRESINCTHTVSHSVSTPTGDATGMLSHEQERFWKFFKGLGDPVENEMFRPAAAKTLAKADDVKAGTEPEEYLQDAIDELISTERSYNQQLRILVNTYLDEARKCAKSLFSPFSKYEIRTIFLNVEQILELSTTFLSELSVYEEWVDQQNRSDKHQSADSLDMNLGNICQRNLAMMGCYKQCLINNKKATDLNLTASKRPGYEEYQSLCMRLAGTTSTLSDLLSNPFQRMARYPMLFKSIISRCKPESEIVPGLQEAINTASQISHMEKSFVDQTGLMLRHLTDKVEHCPRDLFSSSRTILGYLDGYETNLLTGERGKAICLILLSDKVMVVSRPSGSSLGTSSGSSHLSGELLFPAEFDEKGNAKDSLTRPGHGASGASLSSSHGRKSSIFHHEHWKFRGWTDILNLKMVCVEQTDPEGLFCMTTTHHQIPQQSKSGGAGRIEDQWEGTRGVMPESLDDRDQFITKFNTALAIAKARAAGNSEEWTARLNVAELELVCNVFTESQYREFSKQRGDVALFYTQPATLPNSSSNLNPTMSGGVKGHAQHQQQQSGQIIDLMSFKRLPSYVGLIQATCATPTVAATVASVVVEDSEESCTDGGFRLILKSKANLNGSGSTAAASEEANRFLDMDAFQIHLTDLVANLHWTVFHFDPYQSAQLHFSRLYMDGPDQYLWNTAASFSRTSYIRAKGVGALKSHRDSVYFATSSPTQCRPLFQHQHGGSISTLANPSSANIAGLSSPSSPSGDFELLALEIRHYSSLVAFEILKRYLDSLGCSVVPWVNARLFLDGCGETVCWDDKTIFTRGQELMEKVEASAESRDILRSIVSCYIRNPGCLAIMFGSLLLCQRDREKVEQGCTRGILDKESTADLEGLRPKLAVDDTYKKVVEILANKFDNFWPQASMSTPAESHTFFSQKDLNPTDTTAFSPPMLSPLSPSDTLYSDYITFEDPATISTKSSFAGATKCDRRQSIQLSRDTPLTMVIEEHPQEEVSVSRSHREALVEVSSTTWRPRDLDKRARVRDQSSRKQPKAHNLKLIPKLSDPTDDSGDACCHDRSSLTQKIEDLIQAMTQLEERQTKLEQENEALRALLLGTRVNGTEDQGLGRLDKSLHGYHYSNIEFPS
ncbi:hypothetical protein EMPS_04858 [Entomortierella parvispora]|uniref:DH domain-containing protein n=1 Tax=Entomortierella parvispora TaxID=205924 RepID=A0A9P3H9M0_9FUNG|nr:hypothetical protein EMPS_04858 [Entomortierella parvispora]